MNPLLVAESLELAYGDAVVCRGLSFEVAEGEIVALIGANGAGKSTTLRAVAGALLPRAGAIRFRGKNITQLPSYHRVDFGIALVPEGRHVFPFLTVRENLELGGFKYRRETAKMRLLIERMFAMFPRLQERAAQNAGTLSGGEQQMLALARAMMSEPQLLCLDEPSLGLAPMVISDIFRTIRSINAGGVSILLVEQNARYALETASRGYVMQTGSVIARGSCASLREDERVRDAYLGRGASRSLPVHATPQVFTAPPE
jgi:branched-chain amino acid transport system ATP-binding protein